MNQRGGSGVGGPAGCEGSSAGRPNRGKWRPEVSVRAIGPPVQTRARSGGFESHVSSPALWLGVALRFLGGRRRVGGWGVCGVFGGSTTS